MKRSLLIGSLGLLLASCGREADHPQTVARERRNETSETPRAATPISTDDAGNIGRHTSAPTGTKRIESLAQAIQRHKAAREVRAGDDAMQQFTKYWQPVGKRQTELQCLLGKPDERTSEYVGYRFDTGENGWKWVFQLSGDTITNVYRMGID